MRSLVAPGLYLFSSGDVKRGGTYLAIYIAEDEWS